MKLSKAKPAKTNIMPPKGAFIAYKKVKTFPTIDKWGNIVVNPCAILTLLIPAGVARYQHTENYFDWNKSRDIKRYLTKCRAAKVIVLRAETMDGKRHPDCVFKSIYDYKFLYEIGKEAVPKNRFSTKKIHCGGGIHFYLTKNQAKKHRF